MVGSNAEYRAPLAQVPVAEDAALETAKLYGTSKAAGGLFAGALAADLGVAMRLLRLVNTYGPGEAAHRLLPHLVRHLAAPGPVPLSAGTQVRDFVYVGDAVEALRMAGEHILSEARAPNAVWNVCSGRGATVRDFALTTAAALGASAARLRFGEQAMRPDEVPWLVCDGTRIAAELGWRPRHDLGQGIAASLKAMGAT
jgi:nucleoside-diphosphate-sugar epimerase